MDWDATGMHFHLLMMSIQEEPPGSIPNDVGQIRRWLRLPSGQSDSDRVWARVQPQIFAAWTLKNGRWFNSGMVDTFQRKQRYIKGTSKVHQPYMDGTKNSQESAKTVIEEDPVHSKYQDQKQEQPQNQQRQVFVESEAQAPEGLGVTALAKGLLGNLEMVASSPVTMVVEAAIQLAAKAKNISLEEACDWHLRQARAEIAAGGTVDRFYFENGMRRWKGGETKRVSKETERDTHNQQVGIDSLQWHYGGQDAGAGGEGDRVQGNKPTGDEPMAKVPRRLPSRSD